MTRHPRERDGGYDRRRFLRDSALLALGAAGGSLGLTGCQSRSSGAEVVVPQSRPDDPVRLPVAEGVRPIRDGLKPESGTLKVLNYADYLAPGMLKRFEEEYGVSVEYTSFLTMDEAVAKLRTGSSQFDVFFPTPDILAKVVVGGLLQPLNHSYLPNLGNAWQRLQDPFYDRGSQYTAPYNVYSTGIGYRADRVKSIPDNGYDLLWDESYAGSVHILDDDREAIGMSLLREGITNVNTESRRLIHAAGQRLQQLVPRVNVKVDISAYTLIPEGRATVHQCWSGDMISAQYYLPKGEPPAVLGYWYPEDTPGTVGSDTMAVTATAARPVLAHHFINFLLDEQVALQNFGWVGYQPALTRFSPSFLIDQGYVPANLASAVVTADDYNRGVQLLQLTPEGEALWDDVWAAFKSG